MNRGWYVATSTLDFERSGIQRVTGTLRNYDDLVEYARETKRDGQPLLSIPHVRHQLADLKIDFEVGRCLAYRVAWMQSQGLVPNYEASVSKNFGSLLAQRVANAGVGVLGLAGQLAPESPWAPLRGSVGSLYLSSAAATIAAGTTEIQRNIIAGRGLGLPRD
jgi:alkylation response protein AidB-like acyl-CoA dehydrogenase